MYINLEILLVHEVRKYKSHLICFITQTEMTDTQATFAV